MPIEINYLAVLIVAVLNVALGAFWYSPWAFGKPWQRFAGIQVDKTQTRAVRRGYAIVFVGALARAVAIAYVLVNMGVQGAGSGAQVGLALGLGLLAATMAAHYYFQQRSRMLFVIDAGMEVVSCMVTGMILGLWS